MTKTILVADDSVTIQKVVELTFMDEDFRVTAVSNGAEAIARLGESEPHVVIADVHMPGAGGFEVCRRSKELYPAVPVLLLVGTFEDFDADEAMRCGADGHLKKPFDSQELMRRVRELGSAPSHSLPVPPVSRELSADLAASPPASSLLPAVDVVHASTAADEDVWDPISDDLPAVDAAAPAELEAAPYEVPLADFTSEQPVPIESRFAAAESAPEPMAAAPADFASAVATDLAGSGLSDSDVDRIARRMIELVGDRAVRDVAWEVVPDLAELLLKNRIRELESSID